MKHKHADLIKQWADGAQIQYRLWGGIEWLDTNTPAWEVKYQYRIKPEPKPDLVECVTLWRTNGYDMKVVDQFRLVTDGETGKVISAEVLK